MSIVMSYRGKPVDMTALREQHNNEVSIGNVNLNARGDVIDKKGEVVQTLEERLAEYEKTHKVSSGAVSMKQYTTEDVLEEKSVEQEVVVEQKQPKKSKRVMLTDTPMKEQVVQEEVFDEGQ